jgi:hypothetical protein
MTDSVVALNVADAYPGETALGAGMHLDYRSRAVLVATRILSNTGPTAAMVRGAGIFVGDGARVEFRGGQNLVYNNSGRYGGGIYAYGGSMLSGGHVISNSAAYGGGIDIYPGEGGAIANMVVAGNEATSQGSGLCILGAKMEVANNTIVGNGGSAGSGIGIRSQSTPAVTLTNNIVVAHIVGIRNTHQTVSPTLITNDFWENGTNYVGVLTGTTDVHEDPDFVSVVGRDYHLTAGSQLIDAGTTIPWLHDDFDGDLRPDSCSYDIGADEYITGEACSSVYLPLVLR